MTGAHVHIDLRTKFGPVRDQGARPTCLAFAASDAHAALIDPWRPLSCEFAFYHAQRRAGRPPSCGTDLGTMLEAIRHDGQPLESEWPYMDELPGDPDAYGPPVVSRLFRRKGEAHLEDYDEIVRRLHGGQTPLVVMAMSDAFYAPDRLRIVSPLSDERLDDPRRHAVVAVGCGKADQEHAVLVRNSWGPDWGIEGHAWLPRSFLAPRITRLATLTEIADVSISNLAA